MEISLCRTENGVKAADDATLAIFRRMSIGEILSATVRLRRNPKHHRLFMALLGEIAKATGRWASGDALLFTLKVELGHCDLVQRFDGQMTPHPRSISFAAMDQNSFREFFDGSIRVLEEHVLPDIADLPEVQEIYQMIDGPEKRRAA